MPRGKNVSLDCLQAIKDAYDQAIAGKKDNPGMLQAVGADKLTGKSLLKSGARSQPGFSSILKRAAPLNRIATPAAKISRNAGKNA